MTVNHALTLNETVKGESLLKFLVPSSAKILKTKTKRFIFEKNSDLAMFISDQLVYNIELYGGAGLAAPQIGIPYAAFAMKTFENKIKVFFNPNIVNFSGDEISLEEGCLSFPDLFFKVKRPTTIRIRYTDKYDVTETIQMTGLDARIAQHEYDHLQGILYTSKVNFFTLNKAKKARKKIRKSH